MVGSTPLSLRFTGSLREYFRIWVVNTFLTLVTLGVFSAWAKVRKKRYLYSHTIVDGTPLRYLGRPLPILKGRVLALLLVSAWYLATHYARALLIPLGVAAALIVPWMLVRTAAFNARSTSYRNITFDFKSDYKAVLGLLLRGAVLIVLTCGIAYPHLQFRLRNWLVTSTHFGQEPCRFHSNVDSFFRIYLPVWVVAIVAVLAVNFGVFSFGAFRWLESDPTLENIGLLFQVAALVPYSIYLIATCCVYTRITNHVYNATELGPLCFDSKLRIRDMLWLYVSNAVAAIASLGLLAPWATLRMLRYRIDKLSLSYTGSLDELHGARTQLPGAGGAESAEAFDLDLAL